VAPERVVIAEIIRPHGNRGEVIVRAQTDVPGRIENLKTANVRLTDGADGGNASVEIVSAKPHKGNWILKFTGVDSIDAAERFRGADLWIPFESRGILPEGDFFQSDLIGCSVFDTVSGKRVGVVTGWQQYGGPPLMEVSGDGREVLIPFIRRVCEVDLGQHSIRVELPDGLLDL
jgi:16S rRNA processing protein RimM